MFQKSVCLYLKLHSIIKGRIKMISKKVTKAVFPVAGLGTRFLPATKASPKEMLPVVDKPLIQYAVEEAAAAGITEMIFVTGRNKRAIEDHFDKAYELETELYAKNKQTLLDVLKKIKPKNVECYFVRQAEALGLGHAVLCAARLVRDEPFAVILADDLLDAEIPVMRQMTELYMEQGQSIIGVEKINIAKSRDYGMIAGVPAGKILKVHHIVENRHLKMRRPIWVSLADTFSIRLYSPICANSGPAVAANCN